MANPKTTPIPHSWSLETWPREVYPCTTSRARYVIRVHRDELIRAGVLSRVGRELIVLGERYAKWLQLHTADVPGYQIAPNRPPQAGDSPATTG